MGQRRKRIEKRPHPGLGHRKVLHDVFNLESAGSHVLSYPECTMTGMQRAQPLPEMMEAIHPAVNGAMAPVLSPAFSGEDQLCLLLARGHLTPQVRNRCLQFLASPLQWSVIMERACSHQVYPLLYRNLRDLGFPGVPEAVENELKGLYLANALRSQMQAEELARLLSLLGEAGIRVIPLKGVALAQSLYGDTAARVCVDIDILVPPADLARAMDLIVAFGYRMESSDPFFAKLVMRHGRHYDVVRESRGISFVLEVHWILVQHFSKNDEAVRDLWAEARPQRFFGSPGFSLSPEWEFLYLCMHAADHDWGSLKWLADIHEVASSVGADSVPDWQKAMAKAQRLELDLLTRQTLAVSSLLLRTDIPAPCSPVALPERLRTFPQAPLLEDSPETTLAFRHLRVLRRPLDKARYFAAVICAPKQPDLDLMRFPRSLGFLYYLVRPLRLIWKWFGRALRNTLGRLA